MKTENGNLIVGLSDIVRGLDDAARVDLVQQLACEDVIIREVMSQVLDGATSEGWHGGRLCSVSMKDRVIDTLPALDWALQKIIQRSNAVTVAHIDRLQQEVDRLTTENEELNEKIHQAGGDRWLACKVRDREIERVNALKKLLQSEYSWSSGDIEIAMGDA